MNSRTDYFNGCRIVTAQVLDDHWSSAAWHRSKLVARAGGATFEAALAEIRRRIANEVVDEPEGDLDLWRGW